MTGVHRFGVVVVVTAFAFFPASAAPPKSSGSFSKKLQGSIQGSAAVTDGPGERLVFAATSERVYGFTSAGQPLPGFPVHLGKGEVVVGDVAAADFDRDGKPEVAVATSHGKLFVFTSAGAPLAKFPLSFGGFLAGPSFSDLDDDGAAELVVGDTQGRLHALKKDGSELLGFPFELGSPLTSSVSVGRLRGVKVLAVGSDGGQVFVVDTQGKSLPGFPLATAARVSGAPAFGDLDDDGRFDLVVASYDFRVYAVNEQGAPLRGFPFLTGMGCLGGPALADLDGDGDLDLAATSSDGLLYAVDGAGKALPGFPFKAGSPLQGAVAVGDLDRDGRPELVTLANNGALLALTAQGKPLAGFSKKLPGAPTATPFLAPLSADGALSVVVGSTDGTLVAARFEGRSGAAVAFAPWPGHGRSSSRGAFYFPSLVRFKELAVTPAEPKVDDALEASWRFLSADQSSEPQVVVSWYRDGKPVKELEGMKRLAPRTAKKGESWHFDLKVGRAYASPAVRIADTPPTSPAVAVEPASPTALTPLAVKVVTPGQDADGNPVTHRVQWLVNGAPAGLSTDTVPAGRAKRNERWTALVTSHDGALESEPARADALIGNAAPSAPEVVLDPVSPKRGEPVRVTLKTPAKDPDPDALVYRYQWKVAGAVKNLPRDASVLPGGAAKKGERVEVTVLAFDGQAEGALATATADFANTVPKAPKVAIVPAEPRAGQPLRAAVLEASFDPDQDALTYRAAWTKDGKPFSPPQDPFVVPASEVVKGGVWKVAVIGNDGQADSPAATAEAVVKNTPPTPPVVALGPDRPRVGTTIELSVLRPSTDVDKDPLRYRHAWFLGKAPLSAADAPSLAGSFLKKHQEVRVVVTPSDPASDGPSAEAVLRVSNSPPTAPEVALEPSHPTTLTGLRAKLVKPASDQDQDPLSYRYVWLKDGGVQKLSDKQAELPPGTIKKGERWTVEVRAFDGEEVGPPTQAVAQVENAAPTTPKVALEPRAPKKADGLWALLADAKDADGDALSYRLEWKRDGKPVFSGTAMGVRGDDPQAPRKGERWSVQVSAFDGQAFSAPASAEVVVGNTAPTAPVVELCTAPVPVGTRLPLRVVTPSVDADGDALRYERSWSLNGKPRPEWKDRVELSPGDTRKHDVVRVTVVPHDGVEPGPAGVAECQVVNSPPGPPEVALSLDRPSSGSGLSVRVGRPGDDKDKDSVSYRYAWTRNGVALSTAEAIAPGVLRHQDLVAVRVTAFDGEVEGGFVTASTTVHNTAPPTPTVALAPSHPVTGNALRCAVQAPAADVDQEPLRVHYAWHKNGQPTGLADDQPVLPEGVVKKGEAWTCLAWTDDGALTSAPGSAQVKVINSPPRAPRVAVEPARPATQDDLHCRLGDDAVDPDGDPVQYEYQWKRGGKAMPAGPEPSVLSHARTKRGDEWSCQVLATDGQGNSAPVSASASVQNSAPSALAVKLNPLLPVAGQALSCELDGAPVDVDGDELTYRFAWYLNGVPQPFAPSSAKVPARLVKTSQQWSCRVVLSDGELESAPLDSPTVLVSPSAREESHASR